jgi:DNA-binding SARP family transcriptional activator
VLRVTALLGALPGARPGEALEARLARQSLAAAGVRPPGELPAPAVEIRTLGRFEVRVGGEPLPASAWQSRKARDLLRILVARRGRGLAREELGALLWSEEDPARVGHRLSVALSTVRATLNPDRAVSGNCILADQATVALNLPSLWIDLEEFFLAAEHGFRLERAGDRAQARAVLVDAERLYDGDLFEDEPYDDWAAPTREEARATYLRVVRTLAGLYLEESDVDEAVRYLQRILAKDPYDERGHRDLVDTLTAAGRHGESQRARTVTPRP